jgi:hypothetical protein
MAKELQYEGQDSNLHALRTLEPEDPAKIRPTLP